MIDYYDDNCDYSDERMEAEHERRLDAERRRVQRLRALARTAPPELAAWAFCELPQGEGEDEGEDEQPEGDAPGEEE